MASPALALTGSSLPHKALGSASELRVSSPHPCRQLEAIVRISESLGKMKLQPFATEADVEEALRLFQVSTLDAALSGSLSGKGQGAT